MIQVNNVQIRFDVVLPQILKYLYHVLPVLMELDYHLSCSHSLLRFRHRDRESYILFADCYVFMDVCIDAA